jgi:hypothetical protein
MRHADWVIASNNPVERTAHSAGSVLMRGSIPVGRRSLRALGSMADLNDT